MLLWRAVEEEFTGALHFRREDCEKSVLFDAGNLRAVRSSLEPSFSGSGSARRVASRARPATRRPRPRALEQLQGQALIDMGALTSRELPEVLEDQAFSKLLDLCGWCAGELWRQPGVRGDSGYVPARQALHELSKEAT